MAAELHSSIHGRQPRRTRLARSRTRRSAIAYAAMMMSMATAASIGGCASGGGAEPATGRVVSVQEFSTSPAASRERPATKPQDSAITASTAMAATSTSVPATTASNPTSATAAARPLEPGEETVVESVVGQVSGRPIFADEFLEPIADQLRREAERLPENEFISLARDVINLRLREVIRNELFLAEAEASLTQQQKMGLLAFLQDMQEKNIAERGGTIFAAQKRIAEEQEMTIAEFQEAQKNEALIRNLLYERVAPRVIVAWRDVEREYELRKDEFNPPATVTLTRLRLDSTQQKDLIEQATARFAAGATFDAVVSELSLTDSVSPVGQDGRFTLTSENLGDLAVADTLKGPLAKVKAEAGQTTEAIESRGDTQWLHVEKIDQPPPKTLFDVQEQLVSELQARRSMEEQRKYIDSLFAKGIYDEMEEMSRRLLAVAILRYGRLGG